MAKDNGKTAELVKATGGGAIVAAAPVAEIEGDESGGTMPALVLCQGTAQEVERYGDGKRGKFLDSLDGSVIGDKVKVVICGGFMTWSKWIPGGRAPEYTVHRLEDAPAADREWTGADGARKPPAASECVNAVVCAEGVEWPFLFRFKRTGLAAYNKVIRPLEARRRSMAKGAGVYELSAVSDKNAQGQPYLRLAAKFAGDIPASMAAQVNAVMTQWEAFKVKAKATAATDDNAGGAVEPDDDGGIPV
jgi:hypothetical protein